MIDLPLSANPRASILIAAFAGIDVLLGCLSSVAANTSRDLSFETIVVLNEPTIEDEGRLRAAVSGVLIIVSPVNLGLAGSSNRGRAEARGEFIVVLHDDAEVRPGWLEGLVRAASDHPEAGIIGSRVLGFDLTLQSAGAILWRDGSSSRLGVADDLHGKELSKRRYVDYCGSASLLVRTGLWDAIGGFDERFYPAYPNDIDLCLSIKQLGFAVLYEPSSEILHKGSSSTSDNFRRFVQSRNGPVFIAKWKEALNEQEAFEPTDPIGSRANAVARAAARTFVSDIRTLHHIFESTAFDEATHLRRHVKMARELREAYEKHLVEKVFILREDAIKSKEHRLTIPRYELGSELGFASGGNGHAHLVEGDCHAPEAWGIWGSSEHLTIVLPLTLSLTAGLAEGTRLNLTIVMHHLLANWRTCSACALKVNGKSLINILETRHGAQRYDVEINPDVIGANRILSVQIEVPQLVSSQMLGTAPDLRLFSIGLSSLIVQDRTQEHKQVTYADSAV